MAQNVAVKICGLQTGDHVLAAASAGARYVGFVFFEKSPRCVTLDVAHALSMATPLGVAKVALVVNAQDAFLDKLVDTVPLDFLQLHGAESPDRVAEIKSRYGLPVMKAVGVADAEDLDQLDAYEPVADQILVDAKPPKNAALPGGNGLSFDWRLIAGREWRKPWMLAGGLDVANVASAIAATGARQVDVSSGVETAPGQKDTSLITDFVSAAQPR